MKRLMYSAQASGVLPANSDAVQRSRTVSSTRRSPWGLTCGVVYEWRQNSRVWIQFSQFSKY